jgi:AraC-like DNA-binding protein
LKIPDMTTAAIQALIPPAALRPWVTGYVLRDEPGGRQAVRILPETRASVQIVLSDPYWVRGRDAAAAWSPVPHIGLWGPRYAQAFGWPQGHIRIFGFGLTPAALRALTGRPAGAVVDRILPLGEFQADLNRALAVLPMDDTGSLLRAASSALTAAFEGHDAADPIAPSALDCLATQSGGAVAEAARLCGLSERHFRRVFETLYGAPPKLYQRVRRIDRMIRALHPRPWETDALQDHETGFADQPHMIREFQELTGLTPEQYTRAVKRVGGPVLRSVPEPGIVLPSADSKL